MGQIIALAGLASTALAQLHADPYRNSAPVEWSYTEVRDGIPLHRKLLIVNAKFVLFPDGMMGDADGRCEHMMSIERVAPGLDRLAYVTHPMAAGCPQLMLEASAWGWPENALTAYIRTNDRWNLAASVSQLTLATPGPGFWARPHEQGFATHDGGH